MNREEKAALVEEISAEIDSAEAIFAVDYRGISVPQAAELRGRLREADASFRVVKNRLTKLAAEKSGVAGLAELLQGPTALTFVKGDTAQAAKAIAGFNKEHDVLSYKGGFMGETILDEERFSAISKLPSRDVLNGQLAGVVASPLVTLTRGLGSMVSGLAIQLQQIAEQGLVGQGAPEAEAEKVEEAEAEKAEAPAEAAPESEEAEAPAGEASESEKAEAPAEVEPASEDAPEAEAPAEAPADEAPEADAEATEAEAPAEAPEAKDSEPEATAEDAGSEASEADGGEPEATDAEAGSEAGAEAANDSDDSSANEAEEE